jgi:hypothetical protein
MKLAEVSFGAAAHDTLTGVKGKVTAKVEYMAGSNQVLIEGIDSTGRKFEEWVMLDRLALDGG